MKQTDRPSDSQKCAREMCGHPFGIHFVTWNRQVIGCAGMHEGQRDAEYPCRCTGFLIAYSYPAEVPA